MNSIRAVAILMCTVAIAGCKKKAPSGGEPEPAGSASAEPAGSASAEPAGSASAAPSASAAGTDDGAAPAADEGGATADDDAGKTKTPTGPAGSFAGSYNCLGGLSLSQTGNGVKGNASTHAGGMNSTVEIDCAARGNECIGTATRFSSREGKPPKNTGRQRITFKMIAGGLEYNEAGSVGVCTRR